MKIPAHLKGKQLIAFIHNNKAQLITAKCAFPVKSEPQGFPYSVKGNTKRATTKASGDQSVIIDDNGELEITAIGNSANFIDCQMDMLLPDCWKKTIKESGPAGKNRVYHLKNHLQNTDGIVGKITDLYSQDFAVSELGLDGFVGTTQCLVMESTVRESLSDKTFDLYSQKMISQHSIGMQYVKLDIAINDPNYPSEFAIWNKYYAQVINKDVANQSGYFWVVYEIKLLEVSAVLWGANELTPTMDYGDTEDDMQDSSTGKASKTSIMDLISKTEIKIK